MRRKFFLSVIFLQALMLSGVAATFMVGCASNPNKADKIKTNLDNKEDVGGGETLGTNGSGEMVVQRKVRLGTYLKDLQNEVYTLESLIYGDENLGRPGLYGALRECKDEVRSKHRGGDGKVTPPPTKDIKTGGEDMSISSLLDKLKPGQVGKDEQKQLVAVTDDYLLDRIKRFEAYKASYLERKDWFAEEIRKCSKQMKEDVPDVVDQAKAIDSNAPKGNDEDTYLCNYVDQGASLRDVVKTALQRGWINKSTLVENQYVNPSTMRDATGFERGNVLRIGSWSLAFDRYANFGELMNGGADPHLEAWTHFNKALVQGSSKCLSRDNGWWNSQRSL